MFKQQQAKKEAIKLASQGAKEKAGIMAAELGAKLGEVLDVSLTDFSYSSKYYDYSPPPSPSIAGEQRETQILPGDVSISATVQVVYELE